MSAWTGLDFFIFLIFLVNTLLGMSRGGVRETISAIGLCAALVITLKFTIPLTEFVNKSPLITNVITSPMVQNFMRSINMPPLTEAMLLQLGYCVSLLICFTGAFSVCEAVLAYTGVIEVMGLSMSVINRKLGATLGAMRGFVLVLIFIIILTHLFAGNMPASVSGNALRGAAEKMDSLILAQAPERYQEILENKDLYNPEQIKVLLQPK